MTMEDWKQIAETVKTADAILVGASNGLSITEGLHLFADDLAFDEVFGDLKQKYGLRCILHGMGAHWPSEEEKWGFWSRLVYHYCIGYSATPVMQDLKAIIGGKDYFIITSNGECHFEMSGFDPERIYEVEGNWLTMQCTHPCHDTIYPCAEQMERMAAEERDGRIPAEFVPRCPKCGGPMQIHMDDGTAFIPNTTAQQKYQAFLKQYHGKTLVVLELGIGPRNQLIKAPLMRLVAREPNAAYITINLGELYIMDDIADRAFGLDGYLDKLLAKLREACGK